MSTASYLKRESKFAAGNDTMTPPMTSSCPRSRSSSVSSVSSFDSEAYFSKTYVPLSSLPTPPMSSHSNSFSQQLPEALFSTEQILDPELLGMSLDFRFWILLGLVQYLCMVPRICGAEFRLIVCRPSNSPHEFDSPFHLSNHGISVACPCYSHPGGSTIGNGCAGSVHS
jgi:hypothetical protein